MKLGDVVKLKSGGPTMTITEIIISKSWIGYDPARAECTWFVENKLYHVWIEVDALELVLK